MDRDHHYDRVPPEASFQDGERSPRPPLEDFRRLLSRLDAEGDDAALRVASAFQHVAQVFPRRSISDPLVATAVVEQLIRAGIPTHGSLSAREVKEMSEAIAGAMLADPQASKRMEQLWNKLAGAAGHGQ